MRPRSGMASPHIENTSLPQACWPACSASVCACAGAQSSAKAKKAVAGRMSFIAFLPVGRKEERDDVAPGSGVSPFRRLRTRSSGRDSAARVPFFVTPHHADKFGAADRFHLDVAQDKSIVASLEFFDRICRRPARLYVVEIQREQNLFHR